MEQSRPEPGDQARCSLDARPGRRDPRWPEFGSSLPDTGQCVPGWGRLSFALTYGPDSDWVKNVLAAGGCGLVTRGRTVRLVSPRLVHDENRRGIRPVERQVLRLIGVADFLSLKTAPAAGASSAGIT